MVSLPVELRLGSGGVKQNGGFGMVVLRRVQSAQQFQALQAQYSGAYPTPHFHNPEGPRGPGPLLGMFHPEAAMDQEDAAKASKRTPGLYTMSMLPRERCFIGRF